MNGVDGPGDTLRLFAGMLEYPGEHLSTLARTSEQRLAHGRPEAGELLAGFRAFLESVPAGRIEEIYTATFDLQAACCPYLGVHLFGEGHKRRVFLAKLNEIYGASGFSAERERPDHLAAVLRYLAAAGETEEARVLREDGLLPALEKMSAAFPEGSENPYGKVLRALRIALRPAPSGTQAGGEV